CCSYTVSSTFIF
nr:immunoglobulin light chain junction region [Macaca mulatta]